MTRFVYSRSACCLEKGFINMAIIVAVSGESIQEQCVVLPMDESGRNEDDRTIRCRLRQLLQYRADVSIPSMRTAQLLVRQTTSRCQGNTWVSGPSLQNPPLVELCAATLDLRPQERRFPS